MKKIIPKMVKVFLFFLAGFMLSYYFVGWQDDVLRSPYPLTLQHEEPRSVPGARRNLTLESAYPLDHDELQKYYIDIKTGVRNVARVGDRWIKASDKFYDCAPKIKAKYNTAPEPKTSVHYKGQEGEDQYMYQHFFHSSKKRPHYFIELGFQTATSLTWNLAGAVS